MRSPATRNTVLLVPIALLAWSPAQADPAPDARFKAVEEYIEEQIQARSLPSIAVAVAQDGVILWEQGFGWADRELRHKADAHTPYSVASITKPVTATGLMTLVRDGKVDLDAPANSYLGDARLVARMGDASQATVRRLANHTSGLPLHYQFFYEDEPYVRPSMDDTILRYGNLVTIPGERYQYSNLGYGVLDYIVERVSGQSFAEYMRKEVFLPLGMTQSYIDIGSAQEARAAVRYAADGAPVPHYGFSHPGASALFASAHDLARFGMFHLKNDLPDQLSILPEEMIDQMHRPSVGVGRWEYGIGFAVDDKHGYRIVSHTGSMEGVSTLLKLVPEEDIAIVVLVNSSSDLPELVADRIAGIMLPDWSADRAMQTDSGSKSSSLPVELEGDWVGSLHTYLGDLPVSLEFLPDDSVHVRLDGAEAVAVSEARYAEGRFTGRFVGHVGTPDADAYGGILQLDLMLRGSSLTGSATALSSGAGRIDHRMRNALSHWIQLERPPGQHEE